MTSDLRTFIRGWLLAGSLAIGSLQAADTAPAAPVPPAAPMKSPSQVFRELLASSAEARDAFLQNRPPQQRERILAKIREYARLPQEERELRLELAELEFFLAPLLHSKPEERPPLLTAVPTEKRPYIDHRLQVWDGLDAETQRDILESQKRLGYFIRSTQADPGELTNTLASVPAPLQAEVVSQFSRWTALTPAERAKKTANFQRFFDLDSTERAKTINRLSELERRQMESTLQDFAALDPVQRAECVQSFARFAAMSLVERDAFLKSAQRWQSMTAQERQAWRTLVQHVALLPPIEPPSPIDRDPNHSQVTTTKPAGN
jgi:Protein of unknown function (DUF3106)